MAALACMRLYLITLPGWTGVRKVFVSGRTCTSQRDTIPQPKPTQPFPRSRHNLLVISSPHNCQHFYGSHSVAETGPRMSLPRPQVNPCSLSTAYGLHREK